MDFSTILARKNKLLGRTIAPVSCDRPSEDIISLDDVLSRKPAWVSRQISDDEARAIAKEIANCKAQTAAELGVASGFSSAVIYAALGQNTERPTLYAFDKERICYYDKAHNTGDAFFELHGQASGYRLTVGVTSVDIGSMPTVDFLFIDASHQHPWPTIDLICMSRFLRPGAVVALHDVELVFTKYSWSRAQNGPRDLYRSWRGEKWTPSSAPNVAFIRYDRQILLDSIPACLALDWDTNIQPSTAKALRRRLRTDFRLWRSVRRAAHGRLPSGTRRAPLRWVAPVNSP